MDLVDEMLKGLASNGPWAIMAGLLLRVVLQQWMKDRDAVTILMGDFKEAINALRTAVDKLTDRIDTHDVVSRRSQR